VTSATKDVKHAVVIASAQKNKGSLEAESIVRAASTRVRFRLSTTSFCSGVRGVEVRISQKSNHKKTVKIKQARTRESEEYKAKARKVKVSQR
ncbi:hypothetical protein Tco_0562531, partial [Tanacetum coccineum]